MNAKSKLEGKKKQKKAKKAHTSRLRDHALLIILGISYTLCCGGKYPYPRHTMFSGLKTVTHLKISFDCDLLHPCNFCRPSMHGVCIKYFLEPRI